MRKILSPYKNGKVTKKMARDAAKKVLYAKNSSKKEKVKRGLALIQESK